MTARTSILGILGAGALVVTLAGCASNGSTAASSSHPIVTPAPAQSSAPPAAPSGPAVDPSSPAATTKFTAQQVSDDGLPSTIGTGKLSAPKIKRLVQYFEDHVSHAYATGNANELSHYLAGPMLNGNIATINYLNSQHKHNVYKIRVQKVKAQTNTVHSVILTMSGDMTVNYFFNPQTKKILDHGLPGPSQVQFTIFLDQNPKTGTWYWTGEQSGTASPSTSSSAVTVQ